MGYFASLMSDMHAAAPAAPAPAPKAETPPEPKPAPAPAAPQDDAAKRKAHEEAEAKRKAEFDAKQAAKTRERAEEIARLEAMRDSQVIAAAKKRVEQDTELLTRRNMKDSVASFIAARCEGHPDFARLTMHPGKSMVNCFRYINRKAREVAEQEMEDNGQKPEGGVYGLDIPDNLCYSWAVAYFEDPDAPEDHKDEEKFVPKPYPGSDRTAKGKAKKAAAPPKAPEKPKSDQLTLL